MWFFLEITQNRDISYDCPVNFMFYITWPIKKLFHLYIYRHTLFYCTSFYCALQILHFFKTEGLWQPCIVRWWLAFFSNEAFFLKHFLIKVCTLFFFFFFFGRHKAITRASLIAQLIKNPPARQETLLRFLGRIGWRRDRLEKRQAAHSSILGLPLWLS